MSTHNICFCAEIKKIICGYPLLSRALRLFFEEEKKKIKSALKCKFIVKFKIYP